MSRNGQKKRQGALSETSRRIFKTSRRFRGNALTFFLVLLPAVRELPFDTAGIFFRPIKRDLPHRGTKGCIFCGGNP